MTKETQTGTSTAELPAGVQDAMRKIAASGLKERFKQQDRSGAYEAEMAMEHSAFARPSVAKAANTEQSEPEVAVVPVHASVPLVPIPRPDSRRFATKGLIFTHGIKELTLDKMQFFEPLEAATHKLSDADRLLMIRNMQVKGLPAFEIQMKYDLGNWDHKKEADEHDESAPDKEQKRVVNRD